MGYSAMCHEAIPISLPAPRQDQWARHVITVEPEFWEQFRLMTMERQTTIGKLLAEIDRIMRLLPYQGPGRHRVRTLSAAVRVFVLQMLISIAERMRVEIDDHFFFSRTSFTSPISRPSSTTSAYSLSSSRRKP